MNYKKQVVVFGAGEFGSLVKNVIHYLDQYSISAFGDDSTINELKKFDGLPILKMNELVKFAKLNDINSAICAIGDNKIRAQKYNYLRDQGFDMVSIFHPKSLIDSKVSFGNNVIVEMGTAVHTHSEIGNNVFLGGDALIGHHNIIGNHVLIGGNVSLGGSVIIEDFVTIGVGASIKPGVKIGEGAIIGVGAAVINDIKPHTIAVGVPARQINK